MVDRATKVTVIVKLAGQTLADRIAQASARGTTLSKAERAAIVRDIKAGQATTIAQAKALGATVRATYQSAYNGFSVRVSRASLTRLSNLPNVVGVFGVARSEPDNERSVPYIGAPQAWEDLGLTGAGINVGVIDTGIDYYHANFGGSGDPDDYANDDSSVIEPGTFPTAKVAGGQDFVGDDYNANNAATSTPHPDADPLDCGGHGSHTSGTAAGFGVLSTGATYTGPYNAATVSSNTWKIGPGVAPEATLYAYKVFGCAGSVDNDIVVDAIDQAVADGMDVVNMSLGSPFGTKDGPEQDSITAASEAGTLIVASAGNSGPSPYINGSPGSADHALSVAAIDGGYANFPAATLDFSGVGHADITAINANAATFSDGTTLPIKVLYTGTPHDAAHISLGCDPAEYTAAGVTGYLVVTKRGTCARVARAIFGQQAGAAAVLMVNSADSLPPFEGTITANPDSGEKYRVTIPFLGVKSSNAAALVTAEASADTVTLTNTTTPNGGYKGLASFSSGGPRNGDSAVKPDVAAPGVSTQSTGVGTGTEGATMSGTSMAAPHTTGVAALVAQANPTWTPDQIKAAIQNTATAAGSLITTNNPRTVGAGLVQPRKAVDTLVYATTGPGLSSLNFGYEPITAAGYSETITITLHNTDGADHAFDVANAFISQQGAAFSFSAPSVNVPAGGTATVDATLSLSASAAAALSAAGASNFGVLNTIRGAVTATPNPGGTGLYALRIPWLLVPRGLSNITAGTPTAYTLAPSGASASRTALVSNAGVHAGDADIYSWGATDAADPSLGATDVRNVGVQSLPGEALGGDASDRGLVFAINVGGQWSNAATNEYDIAIDLGANGKVDYYVVGVDYGEVTAGSWDGRLASFIYKVNKNGSLTMVDVWVATAPQNSSILELPALASEIGLTSSMKNTAFRYQVTSFQIFDGNGFDPVAAANWDSHRPPTSSANGFALAAGASHTLDMTVDVTRFNVVKTLGWLVVSLDDANGTAQADTIPIGAVPQP
jgi:subtilisin family serine protease